MSTDVGTWTNWVTFEPDPDHSPDPGTGFFRFTKVTQKRVHGFGWNVACRQMSEHGRTYKLLSRIRIIVRMPESDRFLRYHMRNFITSGKSHVYWYWAPVAAVRYGFKMVLFTAIRGNAFVGGKCALSSPFLVHLFVPFICHKNSAITVCLWCRVECGFPVIFWSTLGN